MGYSYLDFGGRTLLLNDSSINAIIKLMANELTTRKDGVVFNCVIARRFRDWVSEIEESGVGCIDLRLDDSLSDHRALEQILQLLDTVETTIKAFGDTVPLSFLREAVGPEYRRDIEARIILRDLNKFRILLLGHGPHP